MFSVSNFIKICFDIEFQAYGLADGAILVGVLTDGNAPEGWYSVDVLGGVFVSDGVQTKTPTSCMCMRFFVYFSRISAV
jgi:hypothetical protein